MVRQIVAVLSPHIPEFNPRPIMAFMVDDVAVGQVFL
jgi:hypothetical protein